MLGLASILFCCCHVCPAIRPSAGCGCFGLLPMFACPGWCEFGMTGCFGWFNILGWCWFFDIFENEFEVEVVGYAGGDWPLDVVDVRPGPMLDEPGDLSP